MIRTEEEYRVGLRRLEESKRAIADTHAALPRQGLDAATMAVTHMCVPRKPIVTSSDCKRTG